MLCDVRGGGAAPSPGPVAGDDDQRARARKALTGSEDALNGLAAFQETALRTQPPRRRPHRLERARKRSSVK